jgi:chemotaxis protein methyltransferase CheR
MALAESDFAYISTMVRQRAAIVLEPGKEYLVESRLTPLAQAEGKGSIAELVTGLQTDRSGRLLTKVVDAMTTNETLFFRDGHPFETLRTTLLPQLLESRKGTGRLDIWCGASSSGQEPYSIAMVLKELAPSHPGVRCTLLATDVNDEMLQRTRDGRYSQLEVNRGLPIAKLVEHFDKVGTQWEAKPGLRAMIDTRNLNLAEPFPHFGPFDLVFLRNVLIYFDGDMKRAVLERVRSVLRPDGYLFLGAAETTLTIDDQWERVSLGPTTAYRPKKES